LKKGSGWNWKVEALWDRFHSMKQSGYISKVCTKCVLESIFH
jgi:hypothetical protein